MIKVNFQLSVANSKIKAETAANRNKGKYIKKPIRTQSRKINQTVLLTGKRQFSIVIGVKFAASRMISLTVHTPDFLTPEGLCYELNSLAPKLHCEPIYLF